MAAFSPDFGIASLIRINAVITSEVKLDYSVVHYQSTEGTRLSQYQGVAAMALTVSFIILIESILVLRNKEHWRDEMIGFTVNVLLQVGVPVVYFSMRLMQLSASSDHMLHTVGTHGMAGIPWQTRTVGLDDKIAAFVVALEYLEDEINLETSMSRFYFVLATTQLFKLIFQTEAHPRTAMLVKTLRVGLDDLLHFAILFCILVGGYMMLAIAQFGYYRQEFKDGWSSFRTLWEMMLGE
jgi:hypothetical protein